MANVTIEKRNRANVSSVETFFDRIFRGTLTDNLFFGELPTSMKKDWKELVVVDCGNAIRDHDGFARSTVLVYLYVKQNAYGIKDVATMQRLESTLNEIIENNDDEYYHISRRGSYQNYNAVNDIFLNSVQINLIIT